MQNICNIITPYYKIWKSGAVMKIFKRIVITSLIFNIICIYLGGYGIYEKSDNSWSKGKEAAVFNEKEKTNPYYNDKVNSFKNIQESNEIIFLGDSLTDYCNWNALFKNTNIENMGISGDNTEGVLNRIAEVYQLKPKKLFIMIGTNDLACGKSKEHIISNYQNIIKYMKTNSNSTKIFVESVLPINKEILEKNGIARNENNYDVEELDGKLKVMAAELEVKYLNLYDLFSKDNNLNEKYTVDGIHLNHEGYQVWKKAVEQYVNTP